MALAERFSSCAWFNFGISPTDLHCSFAAFVFKSSFSTFSYVECNEGPNLLVRPHTLKKTSWIYPKRAVSLTTGQMLLWVDVNDASKTSL